MDMKKILTIVLLLASFTGHAQMFDRNMLDNTLRAVIILTLISLIIFSIITIMQRILDHRLKNRIIEKGITDALADNLLKTKPKDNKLTALKWFCLLGTTGAGLLIVYYTMPLNIHSLAIMAFSISLGFLGYYFFLREAEK
jgi:hypothetical protein